MTRPNTQLQIDFDALPNEAVSTIQSIARDLKGAFDKVVSAADKWCSLSPALRKKVINAKPMLEDLWTKLEAVHAGELDPRLVMLGGRVAATMRKLSVEEQSHYLEERIPVVVVTKSGPRVVRKDPIRMSDLERQQAFAVQRNTARVRDPDEQRAWLDERMKRQQERELEKRQSQKVRPGKWAVRGMRVYPDLDKAKQGFTERDLQVMLGDLGWELE